MLFSVRRPDRFRAERGTRLGKCLKIVIEPVRPYAGIFRDGVVTRRPFRRRLHARIIPVDLCIDHAFESGIGHAPVGAERARQTRLHIMRRILLQFVDEAAMIRIIRIGDHPGFAVRFRQMLNLCQELFKPLPGEIGLLRIGGGLRLRFAVEMIRQIERFGDPLGVGEIDMRGAARIGPVAETAAVSRFRIIVLQVQKPFPLPAIPVPPLRLGPTNPLLLPEI